MESDEKERKGSAVGWVAKHMRELLMAALVFVLFLNFVASAFNAYEVRENNGILKARTPVIERIERCACGR